MKKSQEQLKALSDRNRLRIVAALMNTDELCACHLVELLGVSGATASRHMDLLIRSGLVERRKESRWVHYKLNAGFPSPLFQWLEITLLMDTEIKEDLEKLKRIAGCN